MTFRIARTANMLIVVQQALREMSLTRLSGNQMSRNGNCNPWNRSRQSFGWDIHLADINKHPSYAPRGYAATSSGGPSQTPVALG